MKNRFSLFLLSLSTSMPPTFSWVMLGVEPPIRLYIDESKAFKINQVKFKCSTSWLHCGNKMILANFTCLHFEVKFERTIVSLNCGSTILLLSEEIVDP